MGQLVILDPTGVMPEVKGIKLNKLESLHGKKVGFRVDWKNFDIWCEEVDKHIRSDFEVRDVRHYHPTSRTTATNLEDTRKLKEFASEVDAVIVGLAA
ncbi:MAG: hypothetical protein FJ039_03220 [Chloroflexi bacterium]|nr:hypothetical protein [Chloroflexota bacterium]